MVYMRLLMVVGEGGFAASSAEINSATFLRIELSSAYFDFNMGGAHACAYI